MYVHNLIYFVMNSNARDLIKRNKESGKES